MANQFLGFLLRPKKMPKRRVLFAFLKSFIWNNAFVFSFFIKKIQFKLNCLSSTGRKLKHPNRHPRPLPFTPVPKLDEDLGKISAEFYQQPLSVDPQMALFAEDVDFDGPIGPKLLEMKQVF